MKKIYAKLPIYADGFFVIEAPVFWEKLTPEQQKSYFEENMEPIGRLCFQCARHVETNFEYDYEYFDKIKSDFFHRDYCWEEYE